MRERRSVFAGLWAPCWLALGLGASGCGGAPPRAIEVSEPWTSGDEQALGIDEAPTAAPTSPAEAD